VFQKLTIQMADFEAFYWNFTSGSRHLKDHFGISLLLRKHLIIKLRRSSQKQKVCLIGRLLSFHATVLQDHLTANQKTVAYKGGWMSFKTSYYPAPWLIMLKNYKRKEKRQDNYLDRAVMSLSLFANCLKQSCAKVWYV